jgi:rhamnogalacturonyl hydrolase YesR
MTTTDGAYTVAYPLAVLGATRKNAALSQLAIEQLQVRRRRLLSGADLYRRLSDEVDLPDTTKGKNSSQGMAWWLLGLVRTLAELRPADRPPELTAELARAASVVRKSQGLQSSAGLWGAVTDAPISRVDTTASAGIAAALAIGVKHGLLPPDYLSVARESYKALRTKLTPDGYLAYTKANGASTSEAAQLIEPHASGLLGQLIAALQPGVERR